MYKMLKVSEEAHTIIKERSARNKMTIIEYVDYIAKEEIESKNFTFVDVSNIGRFDNDTLLAIGGDIVIELQKRGFNINTISLEIIEACTIQEGL